MKSSLKTVLFLIQTWFQKTLRRSFPIKLTLSIIKYLQGNSIVIQIVSVLSWLVYNAQYDSIYIVYQN